MLSLGQDLRDLRCFVRSQKTERYLGLADRRMRFEIDRQVLAIEPFEFVTQLASEGLGDDLVRESPLQSRDAVGSQRRMDALCRSMRPRTATQLSTSASQPREPCTAHAAKRGVVDLAQTAPLARGAGGAPR
jgi:hypothetical protein